MKKLNNLIAEIRVSVKNRLKISSVYNKGIVRASATRWNSQGAAIERALEWIPLIMNCGLPNEVLELIPSAVELGRLGALNKILESCSEVSNFLQ